MIRRVEVFLWVVYIIFLVIAVYDLANKITLIN